MPPPLPPLLTPAHDINNKMNGRNPASVSLRRFRLLLRFPSPIDMPGSSKVAYHIQARPPLHLKFAVAALVEILITTFTAELPGVTGPDGLKMHFACAGNPVPQARLTAPLNDDPTG